MSDYRREKAAEMAKEEERKLEDIKIRLQPGRLPLRHRQSRWRQYWSPWIRKQKQSSS